MNNKPNEFIDLSDIDHIDHQILFDTVAAVLRHENIETVNNRDAKVFPKDSYYVKYGKRALDIALSLGAIVLTFPINIVIGSITLIDVGFPIFFKQQRTGQNGKPFNIIKFRNMTNETNERGELLPPAQRVTKWGKFVRKTSLDELLNFYSVLVGDMSIIGPRPLSNKYDDRYSERHRMRYAIRPGLECPRIFNDENDNTWASQFENDVAYVENVSLMVDIKMIVNLMKMTFNQESTSVRSDASGGSFLGYERDGRSINSKKVPIDYYNKAVKLLNKSNL